MVRFKNRYLLCEVIFDQEECSNSEQELQQILQPISIKNAVAEAIQLNYGDFGAAQTQLNLQIKYADSTTRLFIIRMARDNLDIVWNSINFIQLLGLYRVKIRVLHSSGTIKKQEIMAKRYLSRWIHKILSNKNILESIKTSLLQKYQQAKSELEQLDQ
ncbi:hypothetical protein ABPG72_011288 [Tetrahymena utriculariae]